MCVCVCVFQQGRQFKYGLTVFRGRGFFFNNEGSLNTGLQCSEGVGFFNKEGSLNTGLQCSEGVFFLKNEW